MVDGTGPRRLLDSIWIQDPPTNLRGARTDHSNGEVPVSPTARRTPSSRLLLRTHRYSRHTTGRDEPSETGRTSTERGVSSRLEIRCLFSTGRRSSLSTSPCPRRDLLRQSISVPLPGTGSSSFSPLEHSVERPHVHLSSSFSSYPVFSVSTRLVPRVSETKGEEPRQTPRDIP